MKLIYLGGANEVGASSVLMNLSGHHILMDCGIRQKKNKDSLPDFNSIKEIGNIDAIVVSHAHMDHIGSLPLISKEYPSANIYMNKMTMELARVLLYDSLKIMSYKEGEIPIFHEEDVLNMFDRVKLVPYQKEIEILKGMTVTFYMAGHIAGASSIYFKSKEGSVLYTGDYSLFSQHTISGLSIPFLRPDVIISEATYGDRLHANRESEENRLIECVSEVITRGGRVLIPVFALGRSQEVLLILKKAFNKKQISKVNVYVDGMVRNINNVFLNNPLYLKESLGKKILKGKEAFYNDQIIMVNTTEEREKILNSTEPSIIVSSSGMLSGGMSEYYATSIVSDKKNAIILTGYQDEESNGSLLLELLEKKEEERKIKLNDKVYNVLCSIEKIGLSAHADKQEMKQLFNELKPKIIILGHGEEKTISSFAKEITKELNTNIYVPQISEVISLEIRNPRKQINHKLEYLYTGNDNMKEFYEFVKKYYSKMLFTKEDLTYIYYGRKPSDIEIEQFTSTLIDSPYFTQDHKRYFLFRITDELELLKEENKEITSQEIEEIIKEEFKDFPYKKISYYLDENKVILTFDFPRVIPKEFDNISKNIFKDIGIIVQKNDNINNLACENAIKEILKEDDIDKISYLPVEEKFKVKVYKIDDVDQKREEIKKRIGYDTEFIIVARKEKIKDPILTGTKLEQNTAIEYIDTFFSNMEDKPYKKSLKNGHIVLSFITYEIAIKYQKDITKLEHDIGWQIELNRTPNINMLFQVLDSLLAKYELEKSKNPSYLPKENKIEIKLVSKNDKIDNLKKDFLWKTGMNIDVIF